MKAVLLEEFVYFGSVESVYNFTSCPVDIFPCVPVTKHPIVRKR